MNYKRARKSSRIKVALSKESQGQERSVRGNFTFILDPSHSIQEFINKASPGDVICLTEGTWNENLVIKKSLSLRGAGPDKTIIKSAKEGQPVVLVKGEEIEVNLEGLNLTGAFTKWSAEKKPEWLSADGLLIKGSVQVNLQDSVISNNGEAGIRVGSSAKMRIINSRILNNRYEGLFIGETAQANIINSRFSENRDCGLLVLNSSEVNIQSSRISGNGYHGILVRNSSQVNLQGSIISENGYDGLSVRDSAQVNIRASQISDNKWGDGINAEGSAKVIIQGSRSSGNKWNGLRVMGSAKAIIIDTQFSENGVSGLLASDFAQMSIEGSFVEKNGTSSGYPEGYLCNGIVVKDQAQVELRNTKIRNNKDWGIAAYLKKCGYKKDHFSGQVLWKDRDNQIYGNGKGDVCLL